jgi:hypothetical protein
MFFPGRLFKPSLMFSGKDGAYFREANPSRKKHTILLDLNVSYAENKV